MNISMRPILTLVPAALLVALLASGAGAQTPMAMPAAARAPVVPIHLPVTAGTFAGLPRLSMTVKEENGESATYSGVNLDAVLIAAGAPKGAAIGGTALATYVLIRAVDGYRVVFALPELDAAFTDRVVLLADQRNGVALPADLGTYRIVVPGEGRHARWVHAVTEIDYLPVP